MKKNLLAIGIGIILMTIVLSGCQEEGTTVKKTFENIYFDSEILELVEGSLNFTDDNGIITKADLMLRFKNILNETISVTFNVEFCDKNDNVLYSKPYSINSFPAGWAERSPNRFSYYGNDVADVDHVNVLIVEYEIQE